MLLYASILEHGQTCTSAFPSEFSTCISTAAIPDSTLHHTSCSTSYITSDELISQSAKNPVWCYSHPRFWETSCSAVIRSFSFYRRFLSLFTWHKVPKPMNMFFLGFSKQSLICICLLLALSFVANSSYVHHHHHHHPGHQAQFEDSIHRPLFSSHVERGPLEADGKLLSN